MFSLSTIYRPETAKLYKGYSELDCSEILSPFIRCFWERKEYSGPAMVIPDTCTDIIFSFRDNECTGCGFCAIDDETHFSAPTHISQFGIRFYAWSACLFTSEGFKNTKNNAYDAEMFFPDIKRELLPELNCCTTFEERAKAAEKYLTGRLEPNRMNSDIMNSIYEIIKSRGTIRTAELAEINAISSRQLERLFGESIGVSPKLMTSLIRYQLIWQELRSVPYNALDLTEKFGYSDQPHLLRDFKRFHSMLPSQAVAFFQDI